MKNPAKLKVIEANAPEGWKGFVAPDRRPCRQGRPLRYKKLIVLGVAFTTRCPCCMEIHGERARPAGANEREFRESPKRWCGRWESNPHEP